MKWNDRSYTLHLDVLPILRVFWYNNIDMVSGTGLTENDRLYMIFKIEMKCICDRFFFSNRKCVSKFKCEKSKYLHLYSYPVSSEMMYSKIPIRKIIRFLWFCAKRCSRTSFLCFFKLKWWSALWICYEMAKKNRIIKESRL